jgi:aminopeptidase-like protein
LCNKLEIKEFKSGKKVFDWMVPQEWSVSEAWVKNKKGRKIIDFKNNNLHLIAYSKAINKLVTEKELKKNLFSDPKKPNAIPYVTSYYKKRWGFCVAENFKKKNKKRKLQGIYQLTFF